MLMMLWYIGFLFTIGVQSGETIKAKIRARNAGTWLGIGFLLVLWPLTLGHLVSEIVNKERCL